MDRLLLFYHSVEMEIRKTKHMCNVFYLNHNFIYFKILITSLPYNINNISYNKVLVNEYAVSVILVTNSRTGRDGSGFIVLLILLCNLSAAKCIAPCEATEPVKYVILKIKT